MKKYVAIIKTTREVVKEFETAEEAKDFVKTIGGNLVWTTAENLTREEDTLYSTPEFQVNKDGSLYNPYNKPMTDIIYEIALMNSKLACELNHAKEAITLARDAAYDSCGDDPVRCYIDNLLSECLEDLDSGISEDVVIKTSSINQQRLIEKQAKGYAKLTEIVRPYLSDFTGIDEDGKFDVVQAVEELLKEAYDKQPPAKANIEPYKENFYISPLEAVKLWDKFCNIMLDWAREKVASIPDKE